MYKLNENYKQKFIIKTQKSDWVTGQALKELKEYNCEQILALLLISFKYTAVCYMLQQDMPLRLILILHHKCKLIKHNSCSIVFKYWSMKKFYMWSSRPHTDIYWYKQQAELNPGGCFPQPLVIFTKMPIATIPNYYFN